ncbi:MAG: thioesterase family protein [Smithellaceae bacterium]
MYLFDSDTRLNDLGDSRFGCVISDNWSVNGNPNGGYLMAMMTDAMLRASDKTSTPVVTANYLSRCVPGEAEISVFEMIRSRQFARFEARLFQRGEEKIRAFGTFSSNNDSCLVERYEAGPPDLQHIASCVPMPQMPGYSLFHHLDLRLDPSCAGWMTGEPLAEISQNKGYFSFRDGRPIDLFSLFLIIDAMPPAAMATQGQTAWVPTIELSVNVRNLPKTNRVKCSLRTRFMTCGLLEADGELWDEEGHLAAISRQIAQFKKI